MATTAVEPIIPPGDLQALLPDLSDEDALRAVTIASVAVATYLYPCPVPDPLPLPVYTATMQLALRATTASPEGGGAIVSEHIGAYSYRLADPLSTSDALAVPDEIGALLDPWACYPGGVFELHLLEQPDAWPVDWWQRDLDSLEAR